MRNGAPIFAGILLAIIALVHLLRLFYPFTLIIGTYEVPLWVNGVAFLVTGLLAVWLFKSK